ncbi:NF-kappa-B inhibitor cactus [Leguminivora glycinivorella]|uniref:NF-kappa-B inhibitor cactus n=1 Tax=Leguminivora glycinivorella TaxID=1035111 RepID=UPI002010396D|nr:NF-kappa-B inhibitor cactus [Leguminivora glycinivorella]
MSAKRVIESTKVPVQESADSGYLSGPISGGLDSEALSGPISEELRHPEDVSSPQSSTLLSSDKTEMDSGVLTEGPCDELGSTELDYKVGELQAEMQKCDIDSPPEVNVSPPSIPEHLQIPLAKVFQQDADGDNVLHITAVHGCKVRTALLIRLAPHPSWLDITNDYGHTALHLAVMSGHAIIARMLVKAGASFAIRDHMGETPLHTAVKSGKRDCLLALLDPVPDRKDQKAVLNQTNYHGQACVHIAAKRGDIEMLQTLVIYGADINAKDGSSGWTPLHIAARSGNQAVSQYLLERCPKVWKYASDYAGRTPMRLSRRTSVHDYFVKAYKHDDDEDYTSDEDDGDDFMELHKSQPVAV